MGVTIYDVAQAANVSMATVSRVMNNNPNVKPETKKKVQAVIKELNYRPNAVARGLASKKTTTIGLVIPDISSTYYSELTRGIEDIAKMYRYNMILTNSDKKADRELELISEMSAKQVDGLIYMGDEITQTHRAYFKGVKTPVVLAGLIDCEHKLPSVNIDYGQAAYDAVSYLFKQGHTEIAVVTGSLTSFMIKDHILPNVEKAHQRHDHILKEENIFEGDFSYTSGLDAAAYFIGAPSGQRPTAILVLNDEMAMGVTHGFQDHGLCIPRDAEILSFEDTKMTRMIRPQLSSIVQPMYDVGAVSMRLLTKLMKKEPVTDTEVILPHRMELRGSTK